MINTVEEAEPILYANPSNMIRMDKTGSCWIIKGIKNDDGILVAKGEQMAEIADDVFLTLSKSKKMDQHFCSEFFQICC